MPSRLSWLDSSEAEQQWIRELLSMFSEQESRDELGIGQLRDAFGDLLFPGTSTLHTRARYLLIVPWCIQRAGRRPGRDESVELERIERRLITTMITAGITHGLIGRLSAAAVKTLPSTIYRSALRRYGIDNGRAMAEVPAATSELTERLLDRSGAVGAWHFPGNWTRVPGTPRDDGTAVNSHLRPALAATPHTLYVYAVFNNERIRWSTMDTGRHWTGIWPEVPGGGRTTSAVAATSFPSGAIAIAHRGTNDHLYGITYNANTRTWVSQNWTEVPGDGRTASSPSVLPGTHDGNEVLVIAVRGLNNRPFFEILGANNQIVRGCEAVPDQNGGTATVTSLPVTLAALNGVVYIVVTWLIAGNLLHHVVQKRLL